MKVYTICLAFLCLLLTVQVSLASCGCGAKKKKVNENQMKENTDSMVILTDKNFKEKTSSGNFFIKFWSPACGFCGEMAPQWEELAKDFANHATVKIAKFDCSIYKKACDEQRVFGFPGLWWYMDGKQKKEYTEERTVKAFTKFINDNLPKEEL